MSNCDRLKPVLYTDKSYVIRERDPVGEMLFVTRGNLISATTNGGRTGFLGVVHLKASDLCGDHLQTLCNQKHRGVTNSMKYSTSPHPIRRRASMVNFNGYVKEFELPPDNSGNSRHHHHGKNRSVCVKLIRTIGLLLHPLCCFVL
ncbi:unnamed protein product [Brassica oleracea var. botrytis]|uniref:Cyclic nucleotide-binding domain-containing protein n=1 Tax=Brassica oleracea var. oleracea TaxID=109376 RepID=A0A0D3C6W8_BRAOL